MLHIPAHTEVFEIDGPYFFGIANKFDELSQRIGEDQKVRILRMRKVSFIDSTGIHNLQNLCDMSQREGTDIVLSGVTPAVQQTLERAGFYRLIGKDHICPNINVALERAAEIVKSKEN